MVADKVSNKPRGYAFIEYMHTRDMKGLICCFTPFIEYTFHVVFLTAACTLNQLHISKLMGGSLMAEGYWWMLNGVGLYQIGDLAD